MDVLNPATHEPRICRMRRAKALRFVILTVACTLLYIPPTRAQLPQGLERCLPYPTYAQEVREMNEEVARKMGIKEPSPRIEELSPTIIIDEVKFDGPIHLSDSARGQLISELKQHQFDADSDWLDEVQEVTIRGAWMDEGYFQVTSTAKDEPIRIDSTGQHVLLMVHVDEGLQYRLGDLSFRSSDPDEPLAFPPDQLQERIALREGDLFNVSKVRESLQLLADFYDSNGYIDFTSEPRTDVDRVHRRISLTWVLDQGKQYRVGKIEVLASDPRLENLVRSKFKQGDIYNARFFQDFIDANASVLPPDISPSDIELHRDVRSGIVDLRFDIFGSNVLQGCPNLPE